MFGENTALMIGFAHAAYRLGDEFASRGLGKLWFEVRAPADLEEKISGADVLVISGLWRNELVRRAPRLRFIQSVSAGTDQFSREVLRERGIRLASAQGANERAVAEHAMALVLSLARQLHAARDNQARGVWRGMISDRAHREDELEGKTLLIVGLGRIGLRLARLASAFGMRIIGIKRRPQPVAGIEEVLGQDRLMDVLPRADFAVLTCPLTPETEGLIAHPQLAAMKSSAYLVNVARGRVVNKQALLEALQAGDIAGAGLDCFHEEPLSASSPFWALRNAIITPHTAGETRRYESNVIDILLENLRRLSRGEALINEVA